MNDNARSRKWKLAKWAMCICTAISAGLLGQTIVWQQPVDSSTWAVLIGGMAGILGMYGAANVGSSRVAALKETDAQRKTS